jgi:hypothetical protein
MFKGFLITAAIAMAFLLTAGASVQAQYRPCNGPAGYAAVPAGYAAVPATPQIIAYSSGTSYYMGFTPVSGTVAPTPYFGAVPSYSGLPPAYYNGRPFVGYPAPGGYRR